MSPPCFCPIIAQTGYFVNASTEKISPSVYFLFIFLVLLLIFIPEAIIKAARCANIEAARRQKPTPKKMKGFDHENLQLEPRQHNPKNIHYARPIQRLPFQAGDVDGCCEVTSPTGAVYHVDNFRCDCPDSLGRDGGSYVLPDNRKMCNHSLYVAALTPCEECGGFAMLRMDESWCH